MVVDPADDRTLWYTTEYASGGGNVNTRVLSFNLKKDSIDFAPIAVHAPVNGTDLSATETITCEVQNFGFTPKQLFDVGYNLDGGMSFIESVDTLILPDSTYVHTFASTVDLQEVRDYKFKFFTVLSDDEQILNDTLVKVVSNLAKYDVAITALGGLENTVCGETWDINVELSNLGQEVLTSADILIYINGDLTETIAWTGSLFFGQNENVEYEISGYNDGVNSIRIEAENPNGNMDQGLQNNAMSNSFFAILNGAPVFLTFQADRFPEESSWELTDLSGFLIASGGPYPGQSLALIREELCLDPDSCYVFTMFDSYGDGICCQFGMGHYELIDGNDNELASSPSNGNFGERETFEFCATFQCVLEATFNIMHVTDENASDGTILIEPINGRPPYQYSIDGGMTFINGTVIEGLTTGSYSIIIRDASGCDYTGEAEIIFCTLEGLTTIINESSSGAADGLVEIEISGGVPPYMYSIDGGDNFTSDNYFLDLGAGEYEILVIDSRNCQLIITIEVGVGTSTETKVQSQKIDLFPNPTEGVFRINVHGSNHEDVFLRYRIFDAKGVFIREDFLVKYDDLFTTQISLVTMPSGIYYISFDAEDINSLMKVVKQ
jgi:hypothetical protein